MRGASINAAKKKPGSMSYLEREKGLFAAPRSAFERWIADAFELDEKDVWKEPPAS